jgi:hypothetical protein
MIHRAPYAMILKDVQIDAKPDKSLRRAIFAFVGWHLVIRNLSFISTISGSVIQETENN